MKWTLAQFATGLFAAPLIYSFAFAPPSLTGEDFSVIQVQTRTDPNVKMSFSDPGNQGRTFTVNVCVDDGQGGNAYAEASVHITPGSHTKEEVASEIADQLRSDLSGSGLEGNVESKGECVTVRGTSSSCSPGTPGDPVKTPDDDSNKPTVWQFQNTD